MSNRIKISRCVLGAFTKFKETLLPSLVDVFKHCFWMRYDLKWKANNEESAVKNIINIVYHVLKAI